MLSRFGRREEVVPLEVAQRIHAEREAALAQLERSRQDTVQLRRALEQREEERRALTQTARALETELARARTECDTLRARLGEAQATLDAHERAHGEAEARMGEVHRSEPDGARVQELLGDLANLRRRRDVDLAAGQRAEQVRLLARLADVRDSVMWGLAAAPDPASTWYAGLVAIRDQVDAQLHAEGASLFGRVGERFDPKIHEAVAHFAAPGVATGAVSRVESPGVRLADGTLVRAARVSVAA